MSQDTRIAALATLIVLHLVMLMALFFKVPPHPPEVIPIGGMAPLIAVALSAAIAAMILPADGRVGRVLTLVVCALSVLSYGPQKYLDPAFPLVWPAVVTAQIAIAALLFDLIRGLLRPGPGRAM